ncbi:helix-turn-helix domain-containing protein [Siminovitchia fordii]|uniref:HTH cro/C1-type domain-containing protein n=1 Tax=Siminovitchia fordii TaxID=254759 RepID=A0ABQ4KC89_9BACI|nr:helix-turn-helix transcriptional regulator [Siminovitchia fordii]GIN23347.1 hypothetical protein J1TS3_44810 [Siminovitchia fordii]
MITSFGKLCRKLRIDNGDLLKDMANKIGVASSYLSAVENGKRNIPEEWIEKIAASYLLGPSELAELRQAALESQKTLKVDFEGIGIEDKLVFMDLIREFKNLDERDKAKIKEILLKNKKEGKDYVHK